MDTLYPLADYRRCVQPSFLRAAHPFLVAHLLSACPIPRADKGSVQRVHGIPDDLKELYKTVWEIKQKVILEQAADRGAYICQSQSLNIHMADPTSAKLTSMHFYAWKLGLKTGMYYLRSRPKADAIQFTVDQLALAESRDTAGIKGAFGQEGSMNGFNSACNGSAPGGGTPAKAARAEVAPVPVKTAQPVSVGASPFGSSPVKEASPSKLTEQEVVETTAPVDDAEAAERAAVAARRKAEAEERKRKIREQLATYQDEGDTCLNCGS